MVLVNDQLFDDSVMHALALERFKASEAQRIAQYLRDEVWPSIIAQVPSARRRQTMQRIVAIIQKTDLGLPDSMKGLAQAETNWALGSLEKRVPLDAVSFKAPGVETLGVVVNQTESLGKSMEQWLQSFSQKTADAVTTQLRIGIAAGESVEVMTRRLEQLAFPRVTRGATSLARTMSNAVSTAAREATYKANDDVVKAVQLVAVLDNRTTVICMGYDGKVFPVGVGPRPPFHWQCRTTTIPITYSWAELGARHKKQVPKSMRASMTGQVPATVTYEQWLRRQSKEVQTQTLGKARAEMFRSGKLSLKDLTNSFGAPLTINQLMLSAPVVSAAGGLTETRDEIVNLLFLDNPKATANKLKARGWVPKGELNEFSTVSKDADVSVVMWKPPGAQNALALRETVWDGSLVEYAAQYAQSISKIETLLSRRVRYHGNPLLSRTIEGRLRNLGWTGEFPTDATSLAEALKIADGLLDVGHISGTLEHAVRRAQLATSSSAKAYWERRIATIKKESLFGVSAAELDAVRQLLLKKYSPAKVNALIKEAKALKDLLAFV